MLRVTQSRVLGNILRHQKQEVTGDGRRQRTEKQHDWCTSLRDYEGDKIKKDTMGRECGAYEIHNY